MKPENSSLYLRMSDGVRIAVDLWLPADGRGPLPTVMRATRYFRAGDAPEIVEETGLEVESFTEAGFALVTVDVRGTGASFGHWPYPHSHREIEDLGEVVDWISRQPWSNGRVGSYGISYEATAAELLAATGRPAVAAVASFCSDHDPWPDVAFPGGLLSTGVMGGWSDLTRSLDRDDPELAGPEGSQVRILRDACGHPKRVDEDADGRMLAAAIAEHRDNPAVFDLCSRIEYRDDDASRQVLPDAVTPAARRAEIERSGAAMLNMASWFDGGIAAGVIARFATFSNPQRAVIGAWNHEATTCASPYAERQAEPADILGNRRRRLSFLSERLASDAPPLEGRRLRYWTIGEEAWHETEVWPPAGIANERWYLGPGNSLELSAPGTDSGADRYAVDFTAATGIGTNRWGTQLGCDVIYGDRREEDQKLLVYTSAPIEADLEIAGSAVASVHLRSTETDGALYVYLEDVAPDGRVYYLTEGQLRLIHRATCRERPAHAAFPPYRSFRRRDAAPLVPGEPTHVELGLLPISALIRRGHRIRIAFAGHDEGTFARTPAQGVPVLDFERNRVHPSWVDLPVRRGGR